MTIFDLIKSLFPRMSTKFTAKEFKGLETVIKECYESTKGAWCDCLANDGDTGSAIVDGSTYTLFRVVFKDRYEIWTMVDDVNYLIYSHPRDSFQFFEEEYTILETERNRFSSCYRHTYTELFGEDRNQVSHQQCNDSKIRYYLSYIKCPITSQDEIYLTFIDNGARRSVYKTNP